MNDFIHFTLDHWLYYLENSHKEEIKLGLSRIKQVAERLNLIQVTAHVITVGGTNGKGSTVAALEQIYFEAGYQVASYTSPHLLKFNERIRVNRQPISDKKLCAAFLAIELGRESTPLTYFEMTTLACLWYFKQFPLDVMILEVGMGGRHDATNIIDNDLAIITTIDLDHQEYLGSTREAIGYEKAGILRASNNFIYGDVNPPKSVITEATSLSCKTHVLGVDYFFQLTSDKLQVVHRFEELFSDLLPNINPKAAAAAILAATCMHSELPVLPSHLTQAMKNVFIPGRQQIINNRVKTVLDVAHNPQAVSLLVHFIEQHRGKGKVHAVFSALKDKDLYGLIKPMANLVDFWYLSLLSSRRAANEMTIDTAIKNALGLSLKCFENPIMAYNRALKLASADDLVIVYGSFLTVSAVTGAIKQEMNG